MHRLARILIASALAASAGCREGTAVAPSTDPQHPEQERRLTILPKPQTQVHVGSTGKVTIDVTCKNFSSPISFDLRNLPAGVTVQTKDPTLPIGELVMVIVVEAAADAPGVSNHEVQVVAKATNQPDLGEAVTKLKMDVLTHR